MRDHVQLSEEKQQKLKDSGDLTSDKCAIGATSRINCLRRWAKTQIWGEPRASKKCDLDCDYEEGFANRVVNARLELDTGTGRCKENFVGLLFVLTAVGIRSVHVLELDVLKLDLALFELKFFGVAFFLHFWGAIQEDVKVLDVDRRLVYLSEQNADVVQRTSQLQE